MSMLSRLLGRGVPDGGSAMLEAAATGFTPDALTSLAEPAPAARGRRERSLGAGHDTLREALGQKVLHGWLQNRHQTLFPLTVNLRTLQPSQVTALAGMMAIAARANRPDAPADATRSWFRQAGANDLAMAALDRALADPPALSAALSTIAAEGLAAYAYVVTLVAIDVRDPSSSHFLDYMAVRLALPNTVIHSANRRYRR